MGGDVVSAALCYAVQSGVLLTVGLILPALFRLRDPRAALSYWRILLPLVVLAPLALAWLRPETTGAAAVIPSFEMEEIVTVTGASAGVAITWRSGLLLVAAVTVLRFAWMTVGLATLAGLRRRGRALCPLPPAVRSVQERFGTRAAILLCDRVDSPVTFGRRRPTVLLPPAFLELSDEEQEGVVCHELLHVQRGDWSMAVFEEVVRALLWFHPAVWLIGARVALCREQLIDAEVVAITGKRRTYLQVLWRWAGAGCEKNVAPALSLLNGSHLVQRVAQLTKEVAMSRVRLRATLLALATSLAAVGLISAVAFPIFGVSVVDAAVAEVEEPEAVAYDENDESMSEPEVVHKVNPKYPEEARKNGIMGSVVCRALVQIDGEVGWVKILESPDELLSAATIEAVEQWKFKPATKDGEDIAVTYVMTVKYNLK